MLPHDPQETVQAIRHAKTPDSLFVLFFVWDFRGGGGFSSLFLLLFQSGYVLPRASLFDLWLQKQTKPFKPKVKGYEEEGRVSEV